MQQAMGPQHAVLRGQVTAELEALTKSYPFQVPSYFALILRCFSVIEGIALRVDPSYSIVQECFPYLARRLLTDDHPRTRAALRQLLYGGRLAHTFLLNALLWQLSWKNPAVSPWPRMRSHPAYHP